MKTSHILFALAIVMAVTAIFYPEFIGNVKMTAVDNRPVNALSKFWLNFYRLKVNHPLPKPIKHLKVSGAKKSYMYVSMEKSDNRHLFTHNPQGFTVQVQGDTLLLHTDKEFAFARLNQSEPIGGISVRDASLNLGKPSFNRENTTFFLEKGGHLYTQEIQTDSIAHVWIDLRDGSWMDLPDVKMGTVSAVLDNSTLHHTANSRVDSLIATLKGDSQVHPTGQDAERGIRVKEIKKSELKSLN